MNPRYGGSKVELHTTKWKLHISPPPTPHLAVLISAVTPPLWLRHTPLSLWWGSASEIPLLAQAFQSTVHSSLLSDLCPFQPLLWSIFVCLLLYFLTAHHLRRFCVSPLCLLLCVVFFLQCSNVHPYPLLLSVCVRLLLPYGTLLDALLCLSLLCLSCLICLFSSCLATFGFIKILD